MTDDDDIQDYLTERDAINIRNATLEEVAREIEKLHVFGKDTIDSFVVFIREMKHERFR